MSLAALPAPASGAGSIGAAVATFVSQVAAEAEKVGDDLAASLRDAVHALEDVLLDPKALRGATFSRLTQDVEKLAEDLLKVAEGTADDFVELLRKMLTQIPDLLKTKIRIPLISDLYHLLTGDRLTILDLTALLVAVPTTVLYKGLEGHSPAGPIRRAIPSAPAPRLADGTPMPEDAQIALGFAYLATGGIFAVLDAAQTLVGSNAFTNGSVAASLAVRQGLTLVPIMGLEPGDQEAAALAFWSYHCFPVLWNTMLALPGSAAVGPVASSVTSAFGAGNVIGSGLMAGLYPDLYFGGGARLAQNDLFAISQWTKVFRVTGDLRVLAVLAVVDALLDAGSAALVAETG